MELETDRVSVWHERVVAGNPFCHSYVPLYCWCQPCSLMSFEAHTCPLASGEAVHSLKAEVIRCVKYICECLWKRCVLSAPLIFLFRCMLLTARSCITLHHKDGKEKRSTFGFRGAILSLCDGVLVIGFRGMLKSCPTNRRPFTPLIQSDSSSFSFFFKCRNV